MTREWDDTYRNIIKELWDSDPTSLRPWLDDLKLIVAQRHPEWLLLVKEGIVPLKNNKAGVSSPGHAETLLGEPPVPAHDWANAIPAFDTTVGDILPANLEPTYALAPLAISQARQALGLFILSGFKHESDRLDFQASSGGDGCTLLRLLYARAGVLNHTEINNITTAMSNMMLAKGIAAKTITEFSIFRSAFERLNSCLPAPIA